MLVGDDIVDLRDDETSLDHLHPRFIERVFTRDERRRIFSGSSPKSSLWACWAAKESAYKALRKAEPERAFAPRSLAVDLWRPLGHYPVRGSVDDGNRRLDLWIMDGGEWIHALAVLGFGVSRAGDILCSVERCPPRYDPSRAVRMAAAHALGARLGLDVEKLSIDGSRPPRVTGVPQVNDVNLSLSHHGRWLSFAAALPPERSPPSALTDHRGARLEAARNARPAVNDDPGGASGRGRVFLACGAASFDESDVDTKAGN